LVYTVCKLFPVYAGQAVSFEQLLRDGVDGVDGLSGAWSVAVSPDGGHVYAAGRYDNAIAVFARNETTGKLILVEVVRDGTGGVDGLEGVIFVTVSPDGDHVYATGIAEDALAVFARNGSTGRLSFVEVARDGVDGVDGLDSAISVTVSPDGEHVYTAGRIDDALAVFSRSASTGEVSFVEVIRDEVAGVDGLHGVWSLTVSPEGDHVYAVGRIDDALAVFNRNDSTGELSFVESLHDGVDGIEGLDAAISVAVSPDGKHVYACGRADDALNVFSRNAATGELNLVEVLRDGVDGVDGLESAIYAAVSPEGNRVYAVGVFAHALSVFERDATTGALNFVDVARDGVAGVDGLGGSIAIAVSPDGNHLYVVAREDHALTVFGRDTDRDGVQDSLDNCLSIANSSQTDADADGSGNPCDDDDDEDGVFDDMDAFPLDATETSDSDGDGMGDNFESDNNFDPQDPDDAKDDADGDGFNNLREFNSGTNPLDPDSKPGISGTYWQRLLLED